jgi:hypothetical protein
MFDRTKLASRIARIDGSSKVTMVRDYAVRHQIARARCFAIFLAVVASICVVGLETAFSCTCRFVRVQCSDSSY